MKKTKFQPDAQKEYLKKLRIYPPFLYSRLDKWLKKMSSCGWHIVHCGAFSFWFEKGKPEEKEYFTYGLSSREGKYSISLRYPYLEKTYGVKKKKSKINSNENKKYEIVEIDLSRIDPDSDVGYRELIKDRNRLYLHCFLRDTLALASCALLITILSLLFN